MTARIEARRLSGADLGKLVAYDENGGPGTLTSIEHRAAVTFITVEWHFGADHIGLAPSDLVTVTGRGQS